MKQQDIDKFLNDMLKLLTKEDEENLCPKCRHEAGSCEIFKSLCRDYDDFMRWVFKGEPEQCTREEGELLWIENHPGLSIPRVFRQKESITPTACTLMLFLDAYPQYLEEQNQ